MMTGVLEQDDLIRKVLVLAEVDVFECHGSLGLPGYAPITCVNPVKVLGSDSNTIGFAMIDQLHKYARIFLVRACPERLDIENGLSYVIRVFGTLNRGQPIRSLILSPMPSDGIHEVVTMGPL